MAVIICIQLAKDNREFSFLVALAAGIYILGFGIVQLGQVVFDINSLLAQVGVGESYISILLKCIGITYVGEFASSLCKDAGHGSIGEQIEMVAKLSILALSMPVLTGLIETIYGL
ncbi:MAG: stage III sporulation protein AD [Lachnospiraceae bacterium]|nr:stage III sporulation protein AD [Lachnospiraceae bacterium]